MIIAENINKYFGSFQALKDVSFEIKKGDIVGFLGQNGAGKTTLMRILTSYFPPTSGKVMVGCDDIVLQSLSVRRRIGYLPETPPLYMNLTVREYLKFAAQLKDIPPVYQKIQIDRVLKECNILDVQYKTIGLLSKGYKQRVGIAQAIINDPEILILDEPTSGLDPLQVIQVRKLIKNMESQRIVILSTHILSEIEQIAKRVLIIKNGEILADDLIENLMENHKQKRQIELRLRGEVLDIESVFTKFNEAKLLEIKVQGDVYRIRVEFNSPLKDFNPLAEKIIKKGLQILEIKEIKLNLEDIFLKIVSREETTIL